MTRSILFIERDGGLLAAAGPGSGTLARLNLTRDVIPALRRFQDNGYQMVLLGSRVGNGDETEDSSRFETNNDFLARLLASQGVGSIEMRWCVHAPDTQCDCRIPGLALVHDFIADPQLDRRRSAVVGVTDAAIRLAANMGLSCYSLSSSDPSSLDWQSVAHALLDAPRTAVVSRKTRETNITVSVDLDQKSEPDISTGIGFFDHMLEQLGKHGGFGLKVKCEGDLEVDEHHTVEDVALALGAALRQALGDKRGIGRYGFLLPMDEAEAQVSLDLSGRAYFVFSGEFKRENVGGLPTELVPHFFRSLSDSLAATLHVTLRGENAHHMVESSFKGVARALQLAIRRDGDELPTTKGTL